MLAQYMVLLLVDRHLTLMTGSLKEADGVQIWDLRTLQMMKQVDWSTSGDTKDLSSIISVSFVLPARDTIIACGAKMNSAKLISSSTGDVLCDLTE